MRGQGSGRTADLSLGETAAARPASPRRGARLLRVRFAAAARRWIACLARWREGARDQRRLAQLDDRQLRDLGLDRTSVTEESAVAFWRLPKS